MKNTVTVLGCALAVVALFPFVAILGVSAATASAACLGGNVQGIGTRAVAMQVKAILSGHDTAKVQVVGLDDPAVQVPNAKTVTATGVAMHVPARGQVVALATALQESGLRNLVYGDRDSLGLFQQRPSQGWGTAAEVLDPVHASAAFYTALRKVSGWESLTVGQAAQAVQKSRYPDAYAKWEPLATALQKAVAPLLPSNGDIPASPSDDTEAVDVTGSCTDNAAGPAAPAGALPVGYVIPADAPPQARIAIRWALDQLGTPYQWGGHCNDPHGPDPIGRCDCSSLVQQAYRRAGIALPRTTYEQVATGDPVPVRALRPGDLVFTEGSAARPDHVGMFVGSGLIVNAPHTGADVRVESLASWTLRILAARRVL